MVKISKPSDKVATENIVADIIVKNANNPEIGSIAFEDNTVNFAESFSAKKKIAFYTENLDKLKAIVRDMKLVAGSIMDFNIVTLYSPSPLYEGHKPSVQPKQVIDGTECDEIILKDINGNKIYQTNVLVKPEQEEVSMKTPNGVVVFPKSTWDVRIKAANSLSNAQRVALKMGATQAQNMFVNPVTE